MNKIIMMKNVLQVIISCIVLLTAVSCNKLTVDKHNIYKYIPKPATPISDATPLCGTIKGTMLAGKTYTVNCDVYVNVGDTLIIQPGVRVNFNQGTGIIVRGAFFSLGTKDAPIWLSVAAQIKTDAPVKNFQSKNDSAFLGKCKGIMAAPTCSKMIIKWTHIEYCGAVLGSNAASVLGLAATDASYGVYFSNPSGTFVFEDSWIYGTVDDGIRISGGKFAILRNTFERIGKNVGDVVNIKSGSIGDMAYNLFIGNATNGLKTSNKGGLSPQTNTRMYNNTIINCGFRQTKTGKGGSINFEEGSKGMAYNNLIVNCKYGLRIVSNPVADTTNLYGNYGYNFYWADSISIANENYPTSYITKPFATDFPDPFTYLPANFNYLSNAYYDGSEAVKKNNPLFIYYPLPVNGGFRMQDMNAVGSFKFTLQSNSPCIGKGFTGFVPLGTVAVDEINGVTEFTQPGKDIGCYQINGTGNRH